MVRKVLQDMLKKINAVLGLNLRLYLVLATLLLPYISMAQGRLVINELMQSNVDFLMVNHDFPDSWVELYNGGDTPIFIKNYRISPTKFFEDSYKITSKNEYIEPNGYQLLYCDKTTGTPFHYNFNLESEKGKLYLFDNNKQIIDSVRYKIMPSPNVAYGRVTDGSIEWQYELTATPGEANNSIGSNEVLPPPVFSPEGHLMTSGPETITISLPWDAPEGVRIYLTLDGSEPTWDSPSDTLFNLYIDKSTVVRAKLLSQYAYPIRSTTHSYIFHPRATNLPFVSIAIDSTYLYSSENGILSGDSTDGKPNYKYDWRRPANFEYFHTKNGKTVFNQSGEMAVFGGYSRNFQQKSLKCYAKKRFGEKNFKGDFWRDKSNINKVKSFALRNGGNLCRYSRIDDAFLHKLFGTRIDDLDWQAYEPVIVYINGQYKGIFGMRERSNEDYVTSNYDIEEEEVEIAEARNYKRANVSGSPHFNSFNTLYHRDDVTYEEMEEEMDIENFMNVFIAECYASNTDFPTNNISIWKQTNENGRWRWILKDLDYIFKNSSSWNMFKYMLGTSDTKDQEYELSNDSSIRACCKLYERMMSFPKFRNHFITSYATYLGDFLRPDICVPLILQMDEEIIDEILPTYSAYGNMSTLIKHIEGIDRLCNYVTTRPSFVYEQMADYFSLGDVIPVSISAEPAEEFEENTEGNITLCDVPLRTGRFDGAWFTSFPLSLYAKDVTWVMTVTHANGNITSEIYNTHRIRPDLSSCIPGDSVKFTATTADIIDHITSCNNNSIDDLDAIYDTMGKKIPCLQKGLNIVLYSDGTRRKILY